MDGKLSVAVTPLYNITEVERLFLLDGKRYKTILETVETVRPPKISLQNRALTTFSRYPKEERTTLRSI